MSEEIKLLKAIYKELKEIKSRIKEIEAYIIPAEEISPEELKRYRKLIEETKKEGIAWEDAKKELGL
ncbi:MAG: hypothetical protein ACP6IU_11440 [Candidatus Asgardarchaeia archaeon]